MTELLLSVLCSSSIFVFFKLFDRLGINTFQAIVFNYLTAFGIGIGLYGDQWNSEALQEYQWMYFACGVGILFISLFFIMGRSSQRNGVASTSVAVKMSMAVSVVIMIFLYKETTGWMKLSGIALAFIGVYLVSVPDKKSTRGKSALWMLCILFLGSGGLDFTLNYVQNYHLQVINASLFSAFGFGCAGAIGSLILIPGLVRKTQKIQLKNIIAGVLLGIPNYFSIYLLIRSYETTGWSDSTVLAVTNVSVVLLTGLTGFLAFRESMHRTKTIGFISAIFAIVLLYYANLNS